MGYGRNLFVRRVQLEAERRLLEQASKVDLGHFDNSDWHDRLARAKRDVSWRPGRPDLVGARPVRQHRHDRVDGRPAREPALGAGGARARRRAVVAGARAARHREAVRVLLQGNAGRARARISRRSAGAAAQHEGDPRLRAGRLPARPPSRSIRGALSPARADVSIGHARLDADRARHRHGAGAGVPVRRDGGRDRHASIRAAWCS